VIENKVSVLYGRNINKFRKKITSGAGSQLLKSSEFDRADSFYHQLRFFLIVREPKQLDNLVKKLLSLEMLALGFGESG
jgi:hypothetical protein